MTQTTPDIGPHAAVLWHAAKPTGSSKTLTTEEILDRLEALGARVRRSVKGWAYCCPLHDDRKPSASIHEGDDGRVLAYCQGPECSSVDKDDYFRRLLAVLDGREVITPEGLETARKRRTKRRPDGPPRRTGVEYDYCDVDGRPVTRKVRTEITDGETGETRRAFLWEKPVDCNGETKWTTGTGATIPLYRLPELRAAIDAGHEIWLTEGESDAETMRSLGYPATTAPHGASKGPSNKWTAEHTEQLKGAAHVHICADNDETGLAFAEIRRAALEQAGIPVTVWKPPYAKDVREHVESGRSVGELELVTAPQPGPTTVDGANGRSLVLTSATSYAPRAVRWLEQDRIPAGAVTLLGGREGIGKSLIAIGFTAQLTRGALPGCRFGRPSRVLIATSEDAWEFTVVPRLMAVDADLSLVERLQVADRGMLVGLNTPADVPALRTYLDTHDDVAAIIFDPLTSVMDGKLDAHRDREVREALEPLAEIAAETGCAVLGLVHLNKSSGTDPVNAVLGSRAFGAVARVVLIAARDPEDGSCVLSVEKSNLGRLDVPAQGYRIDSATVSTPDGPVPTGRLVWTGETDRRVRDLMADQSDDRAARDEARDWLKSHLDDATDGLPAADVIKLAEKDGISRDTLKRAKKAAGVVSRKAGMGGGWVWALGTSQAPDDTKDRPEGSTDSSKGAEGSKEQSPAPFAPFVLPSEEPDGPSTPDTPGTDTPPIAAPLTDEDRDDQVEAAPLVCDWPDCGTTEGVNKWLGPYWAVRCRPHDPRKCQPDQSKTEESS